MKKSLGRLILVPLVFALILLGCSKDLSRNEAKKILEKNQYPITAFLGNGIAGGAGKPDIDRILISAGYITGSGNSFFGQFRPTDKLKPFIIGKDEFSGTNHKVLLGTVKVKDIAGLSKRSENECIAEYTTTIELNPVGQLFGVSQYDQRRYLKAKAAIFRRYDDGWRLVDTIWGD